MPHRVANFFRSPNDSLNTIKASVRRRSPSSRSPAATPRPGSTRTVSYASSVGEETEEHAQSTHPAGHAAPTPRMHEPAREKETSHHRLSFPALHLSGHLGGHKSKDGHHQHPSASLDWKIESPPAVMYGDAENSTGALVSGQLLLAVKENDFEVESFQARLEINVIRKRPFKDHCNECASQKTELKTWSFLAEPAALSKRECAPPLEAIRP